MSVVFDHRQPGTSEDEWADAAPWRAVPDLPLDMRRLIVFAAHPDDETLGAGGLIAAASARGIPVSLVVATDGEASHPDSPTQRDLRSERRHEVVDAVARLGPRCAVSFLGLPDGGLREAADDVRRHVRALIDAEDPATTLVATTWWGDGHRDHRVLGEIVREEAGKDMEVVGYPVWLWHWGRPDDVDATDWCALRLAPADRTRKAAALRRYPSQTGPLSAAPGDEPILHPAMLRHFARDTEVFIRPRPTPSSAAPPEWFDDRYARRPDPWEVDTRWYERRKRDILVASLPRERHRRVLELGCGTGALTADLARRADEVVAVDVSAHALEASRQRLTGMPGVHLVHADARDDWPTGTFDAVILSEVGYYWTEAELDRVLDRIDACSTDDGILVACHWRHPIPNAAQSGDAVHRRLVRRRLSRPLVHHIEEDFVLDVFARSPHAASVARETGVIS